MGKIRQINIKNQAYYFYNDQIDWKDFDAKLLKIGKKIAKTLPVKKITNFNDINSVNILYLMINEMIGHFVEKSGNKYLVLDAVDQNKEVLKKYKEVSECIKKEIETTNDGEKIEYEKDFQKIRFESNDDLLLNKPIKLRLLTIIIRSVFSEGSKFYPELFLDDTLYEL